MEVDVQCQACSSFSRLPTSWVNYRGPWRCQIPGCGARHTIAMNMTVLASIQLEDRFPVKSWRCPPAVAADLREAAIAFNAFAPRAAAVMLRRALERACRERGAKGGSLRDKIADLRKRLGLFDEQHVALANAMRLFGNAAAHAGDPVDDLDDQEVYRALDLGAHLIESMGRMR